MWAPEPVRLENGLAMNVAIAPARRASWPAIIRKKMQPIGRLQGVGIPEIHLVLEIGVLVIALVDAPAQSVEAVAQRPQEIAGRPRCP